MEKMPNPFQSSCHHLKYDAVNYGSLWLVSGHLLSASLSISFQHSCQSNHLQAIHLCQFGIEHQCVRPHSQCCTGLMRLSGNTYSLWWAGINLMILLEIPNRFAIFYFIIRIGCTFFQNVPMTKRGVHQKLLQNWNRKNSVSRTLFKGTSKILYWNCNTFFLSSIGSMVKGPTALSFKWTMIWWSGSVYITVWIDITL